jgi:membrane protease YdiL (CAAX protease family)
MSFVSIDGPRLLARRHPVATYVVLAYVVSWSCWLPLVATGSIVRQGDGWPTELPGLVGPFVAALVTLSLTGGRAALADWVARMVRFAVPVWCYLLIAGTFLLGLGAALVRPGSLDRHGLAAYTGAPDVGLALTFLLALVVNGFGEEAGWRGYLVDRLLPRHGLLRTAGLVAVVWAGWHLPLFLVLDSFRGLGYAVVGWAIGLYAGSVMLTWLYAASGRSILVVALWHTTYNFTSATSAMNGLPAAVTSTAVMVVATLVIIRNHGKESRHDQTDPDISRRGGDRDGQPVPGGGC